MACMNTYEISEPSAELPGIGTAVLCNEQGRPVITVLSEDDGWNLAQLQDAEEEPMLRDVA